MRNNSIRKGLVIGIITLFFIAGGLPIASKNMIGNIIKFDDVHTNQQEFFTIKAQHLNIIFNNENTNSNILSDLSFNQLSYDPHEPIYIHGNENFTEENGVASGKGTVEDPYIIEGWNIKCNLQDGIVIRNVSVYFVIKNCYIYDGGMENDGIVFYNVTNGSIQYNAITMNRNGVMFRSQHPGKENSSENIISNNSITNNTNDGINFQHTGSGWHSRNRIFSNEIIENGQGIFMIMSAENLILYNNFISNNGYGIRLDRCMGGGEQNIIHHNNFVNNKGEEGQIIEWGNPLNYWNDSYPSGGNYWNDYIGKDEYQGPNQDIPGSDNIGDTPYDIPDGSNKDNYPLMEPYGNINLPPSTPIVTGPTSGKAGLEYKYIFVSTDLNGDNIYYDVQWQETAKIYTYGPYPSGEEVTEEHTWTKVGTYTIKVKARDIHDAESDWVILSVSMPKNKPIQALFLQFMQNFLQQHPLIYQLLQRLLKL